ncbi:unnamed protein product [Boreogadus saida]
MAVLVLLDLAPVDQQDLGALTRALERLFGQRAVGSHSRELLTRRRHQEGERLGAYTADLQLYAQRGTPPPRLRNHVLTMPPTLDVALNVAEQAERELSNQPILQPSGASQPHVRRADYERDEDGEDCFQALTSSQPPQQRPPPANRGARGRVVELHQDRLSPYRPLAPVVAGEGGGTPRDSPAGSPADCPDGAVGPAVRPSPPRGVRGQHRGQD